MKHYTGTKKLRATPMSRGEYNQFRGWETPSDENPGDQGYLVEYEEGGKPNHPDFDGYVSWSPKDVFEKSYRETGNGLAFGEALELLKQGARIARRGWNGKGMFLFLLPAGQIPKVAIRDPRLREVIDEHCEGETFNALPSIRMWTVDSSGRRGVLTGWLASQTDMLSEDWQIKQ